MHTSWQVATFWLEFTQPTMPGSPQISNAAKTIASTRYRNRVDQIENILRKPTSKNVHKVVSFRNNFALEFQST